MEYIVYVKPNENGYITAINSSAFLTDTSNWTEIGRGYGDKYHHAQGNYFPKSIYTFEGAYQYKLVDGAVVECSAEEIAEQEAQNNTPSNIPTLEDRVSALEETVNTSMSEYKESLITLGVEL